MIDRSALWFGGDTRVDPNIALCPECCGPLFVECQEWLDTGQPASGGLIVNCVDDGDDKHQYRQCDWQGVIDNVEKWVLAVTARGLPIEPATTD